MPIPVSFGLPNTPSGGMLSNLREFVFLFHPVVSICFVHPLCPFSAKERLIVEFCSVAFNFVWTAIFGWSGFSLKKDIAMAFGAKNVAWVYYLIKYGVTMLYAVFIRQIVICPCLYAPVIKAACDDAASTTEDDERVVIKRATQGGNCNESSKSGHSL